MGWAARMGSTRPAIAGSCPAWVLRAPPAKRKDSFRGGSLFAVMTDGDKERGVQPEFEGLTSFERPKA
jgi:hypothetical protein